MKIIQTFEDHTFYAYFLVDFNFWNNLFSIFFNDRTLSNIVNLCVCMCCMYTHTHTYRGYYIIASKP